MGNHNYIHQIKPEEFKINHPYFQKAIRTNEENTKIIKSRIHSQQKQYKAWKSLLFSDKNKQSALSSEHLFLPIKTTFEYDKGYCSNTGSAINAYPHFQTLLSAQIERRQPQKQYFKQSQLWYLLYVLAAAKSDISKLSDRVGDIKPSNVFIDQDRNIRVSCIFSSPTEDTSYSKLTNNQNTQSGFLLAPQDIVDANKGAIDNKTNTQSEIFSIGATVLSACILNNLQDVYDYKKLTFSDDKFKSKIEQMIKHPKYSQIFKSIVMNLVDLDAQKRVKFDDFWKFVSRYSSNIKNKELFIVNHPPECLESGIPIIRSKLKKPQ